ncbi:hypothetical protein [Hyalangium rubrum]|uniref:Lipoprotein n=1 Tax=Hyalangium rubrum TaxID=3103134 RepID=A0ABU5H7K2_9BACT|nr:hypothetical protein [Hyalangium sp. s54d21]MDY7228732.1 hypothetical protein [Hyalangium sp. s54d21]
MSLRLSLGCGAVLFAALFSVSCAPPLIRCETNEHCLEDMKCDVRQGLCVDEGTYIENPDGTPATEIGPAPEGGAEASCNTADGQCAGTSR